MDESYSYIKAKHKIQDSKPMNGWWWCILVRNVVVNRLIPSTGAVLRTK